MERTYTKEELDKLKAENNKVSYDGKEYDGYEATQMQRRLERTIRKQKRLAQAYKDAGLTEKAQTANIKLRRLNAHYKAFSKAAGLPEQAERGRVYAPGQGNTVEIFRTMGEYTKDGVFDLEQAKADYRKFLQSAPEENRIYLEQALETAEFRETSRMIPFGYAPSLDAVLYNPKDEFFHQLQLNVTLTHELSHRIDKMFVGTGGCSGFSQTIQRAKSILLSDASKYQKYSDEQDTEGFVSDIFSAICDGEVRFWACHEKEYWRMPERKEKEIFANLFSLESHAANEHLSFLKENFPELVEEFYNIKP